jgi:hypothetical protein
MVSLIGGFYGVVTPGKIDWSTAGVSVVIVGASHRVKARKVSVGTRGLALEKVGSQRITAAKSIGREATGVASLDVAGAYESQVAGEHSIKAPNLTIDVAGALDFGGSAYVVFQCGGSTISSSPNGLLLKAATITVTGIVQQTGMLTHQ